MPPAPGENESASSEKEFAGIPWDPYSEQPYPIRHRRSLWTRLRYALGDYLKSTLTTLAALPFLVATQVALSAGYRPKAWKRPLNDAKDFAGIAVALHSCDGPRLAREINELGVKQVLLRFPIWEFDQIDAYEAFVEAIPDCEIVLCIMQTRAEVLDLPHWRQRLRAVVSRFYPRVRDFQVGQGVNRSKWGFFSTGEYLAFASVAEELRADYPGIRLVGPGILDFETIPLLRCLLHGFPIHWDAVGCALYVDRRGGPRNRQLLLFDMKQKILHFAAAIRLARKAKPRFWITEVNWPLSQTAPYAPTHERDCVSEEDAARYLAEYYQDAWETQLVERVYWWQLVAKGFGLIDVEADGQLRRRPAYYAFKRILERGAADGPTEPGPSDG